MAAIVQASRIDDLPSAPHTRLWTREEYYKLAEAGVFRPGEHVELIGGRIVAMSPQNNPHANGLLLAYEELRRIFSPGHVVRMQLPLTLSPFSQPEPDLAVVRGSIRDYTSLPTTALLVVEISDTTLAFDRGEKASLYASASIPEYWILNLIDRRLEVSRDPIAMPGQSHGHGYRTCTYYLAADAVTPLAAEQRSVTVADLLP
jgi:Uma2 family endonuclease